MQQVTVVKHILTKVALILELNKGYIMQLINMLHQLYMWTIVKYGYICLLCITDVTANHCNQTNAFEFFEAEAQIRDQRNSSLDATLDYVLSNCM